MKAEIKLSKIEFNIGLFKRLLCKEIDLNGETKECREAFLNLCFEFGFCPMCHMEGVIIYKHNEDNFITELMSCVNCFSNFSKNQSV